MPTFSYRCKDGHVTDRFFVPGEKRTDTTKCEKCARRARRSVAATFRDGGLSLRQEWPLLGVQSSSFNEVVQSRGHLKQLQRQYNTQDWTPTETTPAKVFEERRQKRFKAVKRRALEAA